MQADNESKPVYICNARNTSYEALEKFKLIIQFLLHNSRILCVTVEYI